jgi:protein-S-isoprenylcysteine O-methyltransferase Ste14
MIAIGNFFFKYRNLLFPIFALSIFLPSPQLFSERAFGEDYYFLPLVLGLLIAFSGQLIRALTIALKYIARGGKNKQVYADSLVTEGIFNHCRNPLYVGNIMMLLGVGILSNSLYFVLLVVPVFCFIYQCIVVAEENFLRGKFGHQYDLYTERVNRWIPDFRGLSSTLGSMEFNWRRYVLKEYNSVYLLLLSIYIILITHHPHLTNLESQEKIYLSVIVFVILTTIYLFVRYLKKSNRLTATPSTPSRTSA